MEIKGSAVRSLPEFILSRFPEIHDSLYCPLSKKLTKVIENHLGDWIEKTMDIQKVEGA